MLLKRFLILVLAGCGILGAQTPAAFKYQTVCRDASGLILANQLLGFKLSLLQGSPNGPTVFSETHSSSSNDFGVVNLNVGQGNQMQGNIQNLDWINNSYFLKVEFDPSGQSNYLFMGSSQIMAVPYALNAKHAQQANRSLNDQDTSSSNEIQTLSIVGNQLQISGGNSVTFTGVVDLDPDPTNELQVLQLSNDTLFLSSGNFVVLPPDADGDSTNELQALSLTNDTLFLSSGNFVVLPPDADGDSTNELQTLTYANDSLSISLGNTVPLPAKTPWYKAGGTTDAAADKTGNVYRPGSVGIGSNPTPDSSAVLDLNSSNKGFLPPRIALQAKNAATPVSNPAQGLLVYNTATAGNEPNQVSPGYYYWDGVEWVRFSQTEINKEFYWDAYIHPDSIGILNWAPIVKTGNVSFVNVNINGKLLLPINSNDSGIININLNEFDFNRDFQIKITGRLPQTPFINQSRPNIIWFGIAGVNPWLNYRGMQANGGLVFIGGNTQNAHNVNCRLLINNIEVVSNQPIFYGPDNPQYNCSNLIIEIKKINGVKMFIAKCESSETIFLSTPISAWIAQGSYLGIGCTRPHATTFITSIQVKYLDQW